MTNTDLYVKTDNYQQLLKVFESPIFAPVMITGPSGNGKTESVLQASKNTDRKLVRVNLTIETDEIDLIGSIRLVDGNTVYDKGPVIHAMETGSILLLDEIDLASPTKIMCLQSILEGSGYFIKKTGEFITPAEGFNVVATANTKGSGSADGRFIGTNIFNEAFLERFAFTYEQEYPTASVETKILTNYIEHLDLKQFTDMKYHGQTMESMTTSLIAWANQTRKAFNQGSSEELISTRRLIHILKAIKIFGEFDKAIAFCINRFEAPVQVSLRESLRVIMPPARGVKTDPNYTAASDNELNDFITQMVSDQNTFKATTTSTSSLSTAAASILNKAIQNAGDDPVFKTGYSAVEEALTKSIIADVS